MNKIDEVLTRTVTNIIPNKKDLEKVLNSGKKINVFLGIDPTATRIHIGNAVTLRKLQEFVELGHNVTFLIGDFTALIGDTSDKDSERPVLTYDEISENFKTYKKQASKILDFSKVKVVFNSEWLKKLDFSEIVKLCQHFSVGDFVSRELIKKRLTEEKRVGLHEFLYPVMQGYDSYYLDCDIQIGGADQTFNMQAGRTLQKDLRNKESFVLVTGYLEGTDGRKMSKSWGNAIWLEDEPSDMFAKVMSLNDDLIIQYFTCATKLSQGKIEEIKKRLEKDENPMNIKKELAFEIVKELHSEKDATESQKSFEQSFQKKKPEFNIEVKANESLMTTILKFSPRGSMSSVKELLKQNAVDINGVTVTDGNVTIQPGDEIKVGSHTFLKAK
ncbi:MAG TPA: tyrosine--tRNA ligase [Alphaproteobacteria bacterium]|jgi:tyrosyl-tRNA synthetase|nr:tyrosine--tRNA ligase [Alphaproteobacteria bacterium]